MQVAQQVYSPLLSLDACELLRTYLYPKEMEVWMALGKAWNTAPSVKMDCFCINLKIQGRLARASSSTLSARFSGRLCSLWVSPAGCGPVATASSNSMGQQANQWTAPTPGTIPSTASAKATMALGDYCETIKQLQIQLGTGTNPSWNVGPNNATTAPTTPATIQLLWRRLWPSAASNKCIYSQFDCCQD